MPAGQEPPPAGADDTPTSRERGSLRRRARKVAHLREGLVRELGALVVEMDRLGRRNDELVARKARQVDALDRELRGLNEALGRRHTVAQVVIAGIAGSCEACGALRATDDRFCSRCGKPVGADAGAAPQPEASTPPPAQLQLETAGAERP